MDIPIGIDWEAVPLDENVKQRQGEAEARMERGPGVMADLLEPTHRREHGEHRFDHHTDVLRAASAQLHVRRIAGFGMKAGIRQDDHLIPKLGDQRLEGVIRDVGGSIVPRPDQAILVDDVGQLGPTNPAMVYNVPR